MKKAGSTGKARTGDLLAVLEEWRARGDASIKIGWVKAHIAC